MTRISTSPPLRFLRLPRIAVAPGTAGRLASGYGRRMSEREDGVGAKVIDEQPEGRRDGS